MANIRQAGPVLAALLVILSVSGCASVRAAERDRSILAEAAPDGHLITQADILRSKATNAMEAIERGRTHLLLQRPGAGRYVKISHRGADSFVLGNEILLVVDGNRVRNPQRMLQSIPARSIIYIQILSGREASTRWGSEAGNGVIVVRTSAR